MLVPRIFIQGKEIDGGGLSRIALSSVIKGFAGTVMLSAVGRYTCSPKVMFSGT